ncbi:MAG TPA: aldehyde dehydrogenase family protein, partial [Armatimonadota bacterium]
MLTKLDAGMPILVGGDRVVTVSQELADKFRPGDKLIAVRKTGDILHIPLAVQNLVERSVEGALQAFEAQQGASDDQFTEFYTKFAERLANDEIWKIIAAANEKDVARAKEKGRSTTRLAADEKMRKNMIDGLDQWRDLASRRDKVVGSVEHDGWTVDEVVSPCGVVAFVFEGRPNVLADATGVLRSGNTAVFRIGSDALGTAQAIMENALKPALADAGLPTDAVVLLESAEHAAGWALFADPRLSLAVARGSGRSVDLLGSIAREAGNAVSLHGTGGGWIIADEGADAEKFYLAVYNSLDRKVCNTVNVICIPRSRASELVRRML